MMFAAEVCFLLSGSGCRSNCKGFYLVLLLYGSHLTLNIYNIDLTSRGFGLLFSFFSCVCCLTKLSAQRASRLGLHVHRSMRVPDASHVDARIIYSRGRIDSM